MTKDRLMITRTIHDDFILDGSIDEVIASLQKLKALHPDKNVFVCAESSGYDSVYTCAYERSLETDEEFNSRLESERKEKFRREEEKREEKLRLDRIYQEELKKLNERFRR